MIGPTGSRVRIRPQHAPPDQANGPGDPRGVPFSFKRFAFSIFSLALVLTDIPRTGFAIRLEDFYTEIGVGAIMYWGPYNYPVYHFNKTLDRKIAATSDGVEVNDIDIWPYKYDSLSVPPRALATHLNISPFPACIMYREPCASASMSPSEAFDMLNGLVGAIQRRYFTTPADHRPVNLLLLSNWIDRLHHVLVRWIWQHQEYRWATIHHYRPSATDLRSGAFSLCAEIYATTRHRSTSGRDTLPYFCNLPIPWPCDHPDRGRIGIDEDMILRIGDLQDQYPQLTLDVTILSSRLRLMPRSLRFIPRVTLITDNLEISMITRGRDCSTRSLGDTDCTTVFVDDYRYERSHCESDALDWERTTRWLRIVAQGYVWFRVLFLWLGCFVSVDIRHLRAFRLGRRMMLATRMFFTIPGPTIIYGSWLPIVLYALAHYIDSVVIHLIGEYFWATLQGSFDFDFFKYLLVASVQMRNIWFVALAWRLVGGILERIGGRCRRPWKPRDGVIGVRGILIGLTSWLTIFASLRALAFRDTAIIAVWELPRETAVTGAGPGVGLLPRQGNPIEWGFNLDLKATAVAFALVVIGLGSIQWALRWVSPEMPVNLLVCRSAYVPTNADRLWPRSMHGVLWPALPMIARSRPQVANGPNVVWNQCPRCRPRPWFLRWPAAQGCRAHENLDLGIGDTGDRDDTDARYRALLRLMTVTCLTDPLVLWRLMVGVHPRPALFVYRRRPPRAAITGATSATTTISSTATAVFVSPRRLCRDRFELVAVIPVVGNAGWKWLLLSLS